MTGMQALWLPIVLSAVFAFIASSILHMMTHWHASDYTKLPNEDAIMDALRPFAIPPGDYVMPRPNDMRDMGSPEFKEKMNKGPKIMMTVLPTGMTRDGQAARRVVRLPAGHRFLRGVRRGTGAAGRSDVSPGVPLRRRHGVPRVLGRDLADCASGISVR